MGRNYFETQFYIPVLKPKRGLFSYAAVLPLNLDKVGYCAHKFFTAILC